jgi:O-antigen/teichoic acid export membrane protein
MGTLLLISTFAPALSAGLGVGLLGGLWIKKSAYVGLMLSLCFSSIRAATFVFVSDRRLRLDIGVFLLIAGVVVSTVVGSIIYRKVVTYKGRTQTSTA